MPGPSGIVPFQFLFTEKFCHRPYRQTALTCYNAPLLPQFTFETTAHFRRNEHTPPL
jgi:hypothetical protein